MVSRIIALKNLICYTFKRYSYNEGGIALLRIAICDDMPEFLLQTRYAIEHWKDKPDNLYIETFEDADALINSHRNKPFDIIMLDIIMPLLNGLDAAKEIRQSDKSVKIVFLTHSSEYAVDSYTVKACNYLLKPLNTTALFQCLTELSEEIALHSKHLTVRSIAAVHRIMLHDIEVVEAHQKHTLLSLSNGSVIEALEPLYFFEEKLLSDAEFYKCHRSYIVNLYRIKTYTQNELLMRCGYRIPISRSAHKNFETTYFSLLFGGNT